MCQSVKTLFDRSKGSQKGSSSSHAPVPVSLVHLQHRSPTLQAPLHLDSITSLVGIRPGLVLSGSADRSVLLSNYEQGTTVRKWDGHQEEITKLAYCGLPAKQFVVSGSRDTTLHMWNFTSPDPVRVFRGHQFVVTGVAITDDGLSLFSGSRDTSLKQWDLDSGSVVRTNKLERNMVTHLALSKQLNILAQTSEDKELKLWDFRQQGPVHIFPKKQQILSHCDISHDGNLCLTSSNGFNASGCELTLYDIRQRTMVKELIGHEQSVNAAIFLPLKFAQNRHDLVLSVSTDHSVRLWNIEDGSCLWIENIPTSGSLLSATFNTDGSVLVGGQNACLAHLTVVQEHGKTFLIPQTMQMKT